MIEAPILQLIPIPMTQNPVPTLFSVVVDNNMKTLKHNTDDILLYYKKQQYC